MGELDVLPAFDRFTFSEIGDWVVATDGPGIIGKCTLANACAGAKRYDERSKQNLFNELVTFTGEFISQIQQNANVLATIDTLISFAVIAAENKYSKPEIEEGSVWV